MALEEYVRETQIRENSGAGAARQGAGRGQRRAVLLRAASRRHPPALRFPPGNRRRAGILGRSQRPHARPRARKHLAAQVEDHPFEYGDFEGNIPAGNYGAGSVMLWDRGTFELLGDGPAEEQIARGDLKFRLHGEKLNGDFALVLHEGPRQGQRVAAHQEARCRSPCPAGTWSTTPVACFPAAPSRRSREDLPARKTKQKTAGDPQREWKSSARGTRLPRPSPAPRRRPRQSRQSIPRRSRRREGRHAHRHRAHESHAGHAPPRGDEWLFEVKWDGVRAICFHRATKRCAWSRAPAIPASDNIPN